MYRQFCKNLTRWGIDTLLSDCGGVLIAYSGGADSTLLLHFFHRYCQEHHLSIACAHVNHGIRGKEADRDEMHCRETAEAWQIPIYVTRVDVPALARERGMGVEACAREVRYEWFESVCAWLGDQSLPIATAHNGDDQLETVLHHLMRGTGIHGLCGIRAVRDNRYVRPLLTFSGAEIRQYCRDRGLCWVEDSTNGDTAYTRNYIRHTIVPPMEVCQPGLREAVLRMTEVTAREDDYLKESAAALLETVRDPQNENRYRRDLLQKAHPVLLARVLRQGYEKVKPGFSMTMEQTDTMTEWVYAVDGVERSIDLPGGGKGMVGQDTVVFLEMNLPTETVMPPVLHLNKEEMYPGWEVILPWQNGFVRLLRKKNPVPWEKAKNIYKLFIQRPINFATIKSSLCMRTMETGDTIRYGGMTRKLRKLYGAHHISPIERRRSLILADQDEVLFAAGIPSCADKVTWEQNTEDILWIELYQKEY